MLLWCHFHRCVCVFTRCGMDWEYRYPTPWDPCAPFSREKAQTISSTILTMVVKRVVVEGLGLVAGPTRRTRTHTPAVPRPNFPADCPHHTIFTVSGLETSRYGSSEVPAYSSIARSVLPLTDPLMRCQTTPSIWALGSH